MRGSSAQYWRRSLPETSALLPTETNVEMPRLSCARVVEDGEPERAALRERATLPAGG